MDNLDQRLSIRLDQASLDQLKQLSEQRDTSVADLIRIAVWRFLEINGVLYGDVTARVLDRTM